MNEAAIRKDLIDLHNALASSPALGGAKGLQGIYESDNSPDSEPPSIPDCLSQIRLKMKYLVFDLEATRRENHYLRQMLDIHRKRGGQSASGHENEW